MATLPVTLSWTVDYADQVPGKTACGWQARFGEFRISAFLYPSESHHLGAMEVGVSFGPLSRTMCTTAPSVDAALKTATKVAFECIDGVLASIDKHQHTVAQTSSETEDAWDPLKRCVR